MEEGRTAVKRNWREGCKVCISAVGVVGTTHGGESDMHNIKDLENPQYLI